MSHHCWNNDRADSKISTGGKTQSIDMRGPQI